MTLNDKLGPNGDAFYNALMEAHDGLSDTQSHILNARLVLIMANELADIEHLKSLIATAQKDL